MAISVLRDVDSQLVNGFRWLRFKPSLETLFVREYEANRLRLTLVWAILGTLVYDLLFLGDMAMMADVSLELAIARFGVFTPFVIVSITYLMRRPSARTYDLLSVAIAVAGELAPMSVLVYSQSPYVYAYQTGSVATFLFFTVALRPRFPSIVVGMVLLCAVQFVTIRLNGSFDPVVYSGIVTFYVTVAVFLLVSAYFMEHKERLTFLHQLRGQLLLRELERKSERDELTGLFNRHGLTQRRETIWSDGLSHPVAVIMLDIDCFKLFNDVHGHLEGDRCIRQVGDCVLREVAGRGEVFRFGGEEILVLLPDMSPGTARDLAEDIRAAIEAERIAHRGLGEGHVVTGSLGLASGTTDTATLEMLMSAADAALYRAKHNGRNRVAFAGMDEPQTATGSG